MSSDDGYFEGVDDFDESALLQLDAIEAAHFSPSKPTATSAPHPPRPPLRRNSSSYDLPLEIDGIELAKLDPFVAEAYDGQVVPQAGASSTMRASSSNMVQTTLFGDVLPPPSSSSSNNKPNCQPGQTKPTPRNIFGQQAPKTKTWDQTAFVKSGARKSKTKGKGKGKTGRGEDEVEGEEVEFEQFPAPFLSVTADLLEAKHWIFPINRPKRDYQFNIVKKALFENTLVALPTGLGKTFIAGVVMLNYYRWFPDGKVVFVAPTKPLVSQQIDACHETCGIPACDSIELNGEVSSALRVRHWHDKRVFFMTPQTLVNDMVRQHCDVRDIVLLVIDEAHRGTGDYAYNQAIRYMMAKNPHFRVLALTATPGNNVEAVQTLIDGLHISRIEIRDENSLDLKQYIHKKHFVPHIIKANEDLAKVRDFLVKLMDPHLKTLQRANLLHPNENPVSMHPYRPQALASDSRGQNFFYPLTMLSKLARAMLYLLAGSFGACYQYLEELIAGQAEKSGQSGKKKITRGKKFQDDANFLALMHELEAQRARGWGSHPKIEKLKSILINHFGSKISEKQGEEEVDDSKVMVFSSFRGVVDDLVAELDNERPLIRAARFIGQGTDKQGRKGMSQKEQIELIKKFKAGEYNVLVATCIGEEGLDIGEIDVTVCYDSDKAPTRMIQRFGRTGRKREGTIHALLAEGREEKNIELADSKYKEVQKVVNQGELYELYGDVERLIPDHIKPECIEKVVEIEEYKREDNRKDRSSSKAKTLVANQRTKRKRDDDFARNIPDGASTGFVSVRDLVVKAAKKPKKVKLSKDFDACGQDDETDEDIESGRVLVPPRRTQSAAAGPSASEQNLKSRGKGKLRKSATIGGTKITEKSRWTKVEEGAPSPFSSQGKDDSDMHIEQGAIVTATAPPNKSESDASPFSIASSKEQSSKQSSVSPQRLGLAPDDRTAIEIFDSDESDLPPSRLSGHPSENPSPLSIRRPSEVEDEDMSWLVQDDEDDCTFEIRNSSDSSPIMLRRSPARALERIELEEESIRSLRPTPGATLVEIIETSDPEEFFEETTQRLHPKSSFPRSISSASRNSLHNPLAQAKRIDTSQLDSPSKETSSPTCNYLSSPLYPESMSKVKGNTVMLPPRLPRSTFKSPKQSEPNLPEPSYPIRSMKNQAKKRRIIFDDFESPAKDLALDQPRRLHRIECTPNELAERKGEKKHKRSKISLLDRNFNQLFDAEAAHSGDETSEGFSDSADEVESRSDRQFLKDSPLTQVPGSYDQSLIYRRSLLTQADDDGPAFRNGIIRAKPFGRIDGRNGHRYLPSSSPPPPDHELDHYALGSFVVADDADISYEA